VTVQPEITRSPNIFINDFQLSSQRGKKEICQVIRVQPVHSPKMLQL